MKASAINPELPVWKKEELVGVVFEVTRVSSFVSPTYGKTWRLHIVRADGGEMGLLLQTANDVRDDTYHMWSQHLTARPSDFIGPCTVVRIPAEKRGVSDRFDIGDATDEQVAALTVANTPSGRKTKTPEA